jgi:hypothetical protein
MNRTGAFDCSAATWSATSASPSAATLDLNDSAYAGFFMYIDTSCEIWVLETLMFSLIVT